MGHAHSTPFRPAYLIAALLCSLFLVAPAHAEDAKVSKVKAAFMLKFTQYVTWPDGAVGDNFVIGLVGNSQAGAILAKVGPTKNVGGKAITIKKFGADASADDLKGCNMVFVASDASGSAAGIASGLKGTKTFTVSENGGFANGGGIVEFAVDGKVKVIINKGVADSAGLKISAKLLKIAEVI